MLVQCLHRQILAFISVVCFLHFIAAKETGVLVPTTSITHFYNPDCLTLVLFFFFFFFFFFFSLMFFWGVLQTHYQGSGLLAPFGLCVCMCRIHLNVEKNQVLPAPDKCSFLLFWTGAAQTLVGGREKEYNINNSPLFKGASQVQTLDSLSSPPL